MDTRLFRSKAGQFKVSMNRIIILVSLITLLPIGGRHAPGKLIAQACSCGTSTLPGLPEGSMAGPREWRLGLLYEYNDVSGLVTGTQRLESEGRRQVSRVGAISVSRGLSARLSVTVLLSMLEKERQVTDLVRLRGIGDPVILLHLNLHPRRSYPQRELYLGVGLKAPLGANDRRLNGLLIAGDLQPGTGAWDGLITVFAASEVFPPHRARLFLAGTFQLTGSAHRPGYHNLLYRYGSDFTMLLGTGYTFRNGLELTLGGRYRYRAPDLLDSIAVPNTGGRWLLLEPGAYLALGGSVTLGLSARVPLYQDLNGAIQFTTRYGLSLSAGYSFNT